MFILTVGKFEKGLFFKTNFEFFVIYCIFFALTPSIDNYIVRQNGTSNYYSQREKKIADPVFYIAYSILKKALHRFSRHYLRMYVFIATTIFLLCKYVKMMLESLPCIQSIFGSILAYFFFL